jgi:hypothetical protein
MKFVVFMVLVGLPVFKFGNWLDLRASSPLLAAKAPAVRVRITSSK